MPQCSQKQLRQLSAFLDSMKGGGGGGRAGGGTNKKKKKPDADEKPVAWTCYRCGTDHHNDRKQDCRECGDVRVDWHPVGKPGIMQAQPKGKAKAKAKAKAGGARRERDSAWAAPDGGGETLAQLFDLYLGPEPEPSEAPGEEEPEDIVSDTGEDMEEEDPDETARGKREFAERMVGLLKKEDPFGELERYQAILRELPAVQTPPEERKGPRGPARLRRGRPQEGGRRSGREAWQASRRPRHGAR